MKWSVRKIIGFGILGVVMLVFTVFAVWRLELENDVQHRLSILRATGRPTSGVELNSYYSPVPESENAALVITQAFAQMANYPDGRSNEVKNFKFPSGSEKLAPEQKELLAGYVELNRAAIQTARRGINLTKSRYPVDMSPGFATLLPHLVHIKDLARVISCEGVLAAEDNKPEQSIQSISTLVHLSRTLENEPLLISDLIRISIDKMTEATLERCINAGQQNEENLAALDHALQGWEGTNTLQRAMAGEEAMTVPMFHMNFAQFYCFTKSDGIDVTKVKGGPGSIPLTFLMRASGVFQRDLQFYLALMETNNDFSKLSPPDNLAITNVWQQAMKEIRRRNLFMSAMLIPALDTAYLKNADAMANVRISRIAVAIEKFRLLQNRLPHNLDDLNDLVSVQLRTDPFDGQSLRYKRLEKGYVIYSVGRDGEDNGGKQRPVDAKSSDKTPYDITFTVER